MELKKWQEGGSFFVYKDRHQIFFRKELNNKPTLVLLHGFPTCSWDWHKMWESLSNYFSLIAIDFIGFGFSDKPKAYSYSIFDQADLVEAILMDHGIRKYHLLAHDYGDTVAQELMARSMNEQYLFCILSVCLLNGGIYQEGNHPRPIQKLLASPFGKFLGLFLNKDLLHRNFNRIFGQNTKASDMDIDQFYEGIIFKNGKYRIHQVIQYLHERKQNQKRWESVLSSFDKPCLSIIGMVDPISGKGIAAQIKKKASNFKVVELKEIGHYPQFESPKEVFSLYLKFQNEKF